MTEMVSAVEGSVAAGSSGYLDQLHDTVGSSDNPVVDAALTLLADWALGVVLVTVLGGLVVTFL